MTGKHNETIVPKSKILLHVILKFDYFKNIFRFISPTNIHFKNKYELSINPAKSPKCLYIYIYIGIHGNYTRYVSI